MWRNKLVAALGPVFLLFLIVPPVEAAAPDSAGTPPEGSEPGLATSDFGAPHFVDFFAPFYSIEGLRDTRLFLLNTIADPITVDVVARSEGRELPLGSYAIEPQRHLELSLRERLAGFEDEFRTGNLRLSLLGDPDTLQAWAVIAEPDGQTFELPLLAPEESSSNELVGFWDARPQGVTGPTPVTFYFLNSSSHELSLSLTSGERGPGDSATLRLQPGEAVPVNGLGKAAIGRLGWLKVKHDGEPGDVVGVGIIGGSTLIQAVHLIPRGEAEASERHESLPLPIRRSEEASGVDGSRGWLTLLNVASGGQEVLLEALDTASGASIGRSSIRVEPWAVTTVPLARLIPRGADSRHARLRVQGNAPGLLVRGSEIAPPGLAAELPFFSAYHAHGNGTYPLPDLERYQTVTPIINLGDEPAEIVAQVYWDGGTFALGPLTIAPGASHMIDLEELAKTAAPDLLGRTLDPNRPPAVLKWTVMSGSSELLGRTLVRPRGSEDRFGFNCFGCCFQNPKGRVVPSGVEFFPGQSLDFEVAIVYTTCSGEMGPYPTTASSLSVPSPFTWNGHIVGATGPALEILSFTGSGTKTSSGCQEFTVNINGFGTGDTCKDHLKRPDSPGQTWNAGATCSSQTGSCSLCRACCEQIKAYNLCRRVNPDLADKEYQTCLAHCVTDICG